VLQTLQRIIEEVNNAHDFNEALILMVHRLREAIDTDACSIFLINHKTNDYVLMATKGLNPAAVGKARVGLSQGLMGLVGEKEEAINIPDAKSHPRHYTIPGMIEDNYCGYLAVPILYQRRLYGVLVAQQQAAECFGEEQEAFLATMSAQLGGIIAHAEATGLVEHLTGRYQSPFPGDIFLGSAASPRVGLGQAVVIYPLADLNAVPEKETENIEEQIALFRRALSLVRNEIQDLCRRLESSLSTEDQALFDAYLQILSEDGIGVEVEEEIRGGIWAEGALKRVIKSHIKQFDQIHNDCLRERSNDFRDLGTRVLAYLQENSHMTRTYYPNTILIGEEISPTHLAEVPKECLKGIVSGKGSTNSHVAILASALGVPAVLGVSDLRVSGLEGQTIIVNGYSGQVFLNPKPHVRKEIERLIQEEAQLDRDLEGLSHAPAETQDGHRVEMLVNTGLSSDLHLSLSVGADGVGLYRTEIPFIMRDRFPSREEQRIIYRQLLGAFSPRPVIMRTLDIGGDKALPYFPISEDNPFLGWRGIRVTLDHPDIFLVQIRSMMRASESFHNLKIMLPMISDVSEVDEALVLLKKAYADVRAEGYQVQMPEVGVMIEVPSAVYQAEILARKVDFLSVGSNDLTQYMLAVDRNNVRVAGLYDSLHPSVLKALVHVVESAKKSKTPVGICGEMAADPLGVILLIGAGFESLSINAINVSRTKWVIRRLHLQRAKELLQVALTLERGDMVREMLSEELLVMGLGGLIRAGRH
jgi:phosphotransferase system enzyme I (PtsP)